jgi:hypothetical protein
LPLAEASAQVILAMIANRSLAASRSMPTVRKSSMMSRSILERSFAGHPA